MRFALFLHDGLPDTETAERHSAILYAGNEITTDARFNICIEKPLCSVSKEVFRMTVENDDLAILCGHVFDKVLPCVADPEKIRVIVKIGRDLLEILPYMKGYLKKGIYVKEVPFMSFKKDGKNITLYRDSIAITKLADEQEAIEELKYLSTIIQEVINNKEAIEPDYSYGRKISPVVLYRLMPKTNCGRCGEATCLAFVVKLINDERAVSGCPPLFSNGYEEAKEKVIEALAE